MTQEFRLDLIALGSLGLALAFSGLWAPQGANAVIGWWLGVAWMVANLWALERLIRAALRPKGEVDSRGATLYGLLVVLVLPGVLLGLLFWAQGASALEPMAAGFGVPLAVLALRAVGGLLGGKKKIAP